MTKNEAAIAAMAIMFGALMDRALKNFDARQFVVKVAEHWEISEAMLEQVANDMKSFLKDVDPAWLNLKL
jgi:hypothetical protein